VVDREKFALEELRSVERCPTGAIVWLNGAQFARVPATVVREAA
jgi:hypothetical protein